MMVNCLNNSHPQGHELVLHILYHLHSLVISDSTSSAAAVYEKFLLGVVGGLLTYRY